MHDSKITPRLDLQELLNDQLRLFCCIVPHDQEVRIFLTYRNVKFLVETQHPGQYRAVLDREVDATGAVSAVELRHAHQLRASQCPPIAQLMRMLSVQIDRRQHPQEEQDQPAP